MRYYATYECKDHPDKFECPDNLIVHNEETGTYGLIIHYGGESYVKIRFCPWCGANLALSDGDTIERP
jgi:hypothetical protein